MRGKIVLAVLLLIIVILTVVFIMGQDGVDKATKQYLQPISLNYWRVWDGPDAFADLIAQYNSSHPFVTINYRKLTYEEYENALIEAFASDRGPDIFSIHNTWLRKYQSKNLIGSVPSKTTMAFPYIKGTVKKEVAYELKTTQGITTKNVDSYFIDTVYDDIVIKAKNDANVLSEQVFGLPLAIDTLILFYNKDLFNNAGITTPPEYWNREFQQNVKKLTKQNNQGEIIQSGIALGGSNNIVRSTDILSLLMMQNGTNMMEGGAVKFNQNAGSSKDKSPGIDALRFYTDFSNPAKEVYSWNNGLEDSLKMFVDNKLAMMIGYKYMLPEIKARAPKLNFGIAPIPQIEGNSQKTNYANYWVEVVSKSILANPDNLKKGAFYTKQKYNTAWDFIQFIANKKNVPVYLSKTQNATALKSLIDGQIEDEEMSMFANQILTSKSWYRGNDANAAEMILKQMIDKTITDQSKIVENIDFAASKIQQTVD